MVYRLISALMRSNNIVSTQSIYCSSRRNCSTGPSDQVKDGEKTEPIVLPPKKRLAILTCMDARINPFKQLGFEEGDAHIIRNAGGMARDAIRSIIISQRLLGTREIAVYHHTGCGMVTFTSPTLRQLVKDATPDAARMVDQIDFLEFDNLEESVKSDVKFLQDNPLVLKDTKITGWIHDVETGEATRVV